MTVSLLPPPKPPNVLHRNPDSIVDRVHKIIAALAAEDPEAGELAVLRSLLNEVTEADAVVLLKDSFDFEPLTHTIYEQFSARGAEWGADVRQELVTALFFCGLDAEAIRVQAAS